MDPYVSINLTVNLIYSYQLKLFTEQTKPSGITLANGLVA